MKNKYTATDKEFRADFMYSFIVFDIDAFIRIYKELPFSSRSQFGSDSSLDRSSLCVWEFVQNNSK